MPANARSLRLTDVYRERLIALRAHAEQVTQGAWHQVDLADLEPTFGDWLGKTSSTVAGAQLQAVRLSVAYLSAYIASEVGHRVSTPRLDTSAYVGFSRDGRSLAEAYDSPRIGVLVALKDGADNEKALKAGLDRALRAVELDTMHAGRQSLHDAMLGDDRIAGYRRALRGTCAACASVASGTFDGTIRFEVHPSCGCVQEPVVKNVRDRFPRLTGAAIFAAKDKQQQDEMLGPEAAQAVRDGLPLHRLVKHEPMENEQDWITQRPLDEITDTAIRPATP